MKTIGVGLAGAAAYSGAASAASISGSVDWSTAVETAGNYAYSLNAYNGTVPKYMNDSTLQTRWEQMNAGMVRIHRSQMMEDPDDNAAGWVNDPDTSNYNWAETRIQDCYDGSFTYGAVRMQNIPNWPSYFDDGDGFLQTDKFDEYAQFCADLVDIVNNQLGYDVARWEVTNEKDDNYGDAGRLDELADIFSRCAQAMKNVDSSITVGGPAFERPDLTGYVDTFVSYAHQDMDFLSYHSYATGDTDNTDAVYDTAAGWGKHTDDMQEIWSSYSERDIEFHHDEFNISWSPPDDRMNDETSAVFDALAMKSIVEAGATGTQAWNAADGWYGKCDDDSNWSRRPSSYLYDVYNDHMRGDVVSVSSNDPSEIELYGVNNGDYRNLAIINRSNGTDHTVSISFSGWTDEPADTDLFDEYHVGAGGLTTGSVEYGTLQSGYAVPADSISVVTIYDGSDSTAPTAPSNLSSPYHTDSSVDLDWDESTDEGGSGVSYYNVYVDGAKDHRVLHPTTATTVTGLSSNTSYDFYVTAVDGNGNESSASNTVTVTTDEASQEFTTSQDIGNVNAEGSMSWSSGTYTIEGAGDSIWHRSDEFHFAYTQVSGDCTLVARVESVEHTDDWAKAGVMVRETLQNDSKHAMTIVAPNEKASFQWRPETNKSTSRTSDDGNPAPHFVKIERSGDTLTGYHSGDGSSWSMLDSVTISMSNDVYVGLPVCSSNRGTLTTAVFDHVDLKDSS